MDQRIDIWNIFHDGEITAVSQENSQTLKIFVSIPYIRRRLKPLGDSFVLILSGLKRFEFSSLNGAISSLQDEIDLGEPEILSTDSESMPVMITTTMGQLTLDFDSISFALDTGEAIDFESIEKECESYWAEWSEKNDSNPKE
jgi:hypothetical protein